MPKRRRSPGRGGGRRAKRRRKHLYLILDDWSRGYSIRKVDLSSGSDPDLDLRRARSADGSCRRCTGRRDRLHRRGEQCLPPAVFHLEAPRKLPYYFAAAFGTKIMAMHPRINPEYLRINQNLEPNPVSVFDVRTRTLSFGCRPDALADIYVFQPMYIPIGDRLFALSRKSFHLLSPSPVGEHEPAGGQCCAGRTWRTLPAPPFEIQSDDSYAVHPDGRTIFVTVGLITNSTFSFHMPEEAEEGFLGWKPRGAWTLPTCGFGTQGPAHFDPELNAWVGIAREPCTDPDAYGHICACEVVPADPNDSDGQPPVTKLCKEKLIPMSEDPEGSHIGATLLYMGAKSRYCLVESAYIEGKKKNDVAERSQFYAQEDEDDEVEKEDPRRYLFRVTTFSLKVDKNGDLTTGDSRRVRYYSMPEGASFQCVYEAPVAFWM